MTAAAPAPKMGLKGTPSECSSTMASWPLQLSRFNVQFSYERDRYTDVQMKRNVQSAGNCRFAAVEVLLSWGSGSAKVPIAAFSGPINVCGAATPSVAQRPPDTSTMENAKVGRHAGYVCNDSR